jgi:acetyl-CoA carboxylase carboxyl transferase subunit alpha
MKVSYLEFEKPIAELDSKIAELETLSGRKDGHPLRMS